MNKKIIFLDIDGTLTIPGTNVPPDSALKAIDGARKNGHLVYLCSGRNYQMLSPLLKYPFDGVIASAGGYIRCGSEVIFDCPMKEEEGKRVMSILKEHGIFRTAECLNGSFTDEGFKIFLEEHAGEGGNSELLRWRKQIESELNIRPMSEYQGQPLYKIVVMASSEEQLEAAGKEAGDQYHMCIQGTDAFGIANGEISVRNIDKGTGVEKVCEKLNIPISDTIAFGDSMNDLEMMQTAGLSVCMENGNPALKALADDVCPAVDQDGLYQAFQKYELL